MSIPSLQRSSSAPHTVASLAQARQPLPRTKSHLHMHKAETRAFLKPLVTSVPLAGSSGEREDPFNLLGFFPPSDEKESWRWLHTEPKIEEESLVSDEEDAESAESVIMREEQVGVLSLFSGGGGGSRKAEETTGEQQLLSPFRLDGAEEWEAVYQAFTGRRRAEGAGDAGPEGGFGVLFFPGSS